MAKGLRMGMSHVRMLKDNKLAFMLFILPSIHFNYSRSKIKWASQIEQMNKRK